MESSNAKYLNFFAFFDTLDWKSEIVVKKITGKVEYVNYDSKRIMKCLNIGDLSGIEMPFRSNSPWDVWREVFGMNETVFEMHCASLIESEPLFGIIKYVVAENGNKVMEWRYVDDNGKQ